MKIGIDISQIVYGTGVSRYTQQLIENLAKIDTKNQYVLFFSSLRQDIQKFNLKIDSGKIKLKVFKFPITFLELLWNQVHILDIENLIGKIDIFHSSDWIQPPCEAKKISTVHDLSFLHYPQAFPKKIIQVHKRRLNWVRRECDMILADSKVTKKDLVGLLNFDEKKIRVVYLGVDEKFKIKNQAASWQIKIKKIREKYKINSNYILSVGTLEPRKNLKRVIEAFSKLRSNLKLVVAGKLGWGEETFALVKEKRNDIIFTGFVPEEDLPYLYAGAKCFVYPSLYEGFGLPVLEAMAAGCPVITSNLSSLPEVAGKATILVNPQNLDQIVQAMQKMILDNSLANKLIMLGKKQVENFRWENTARETLKVYEELKKK